MKNSSKKLPLVSVIALCYNQARYCIETLDSIINQTYQNIEIIILDDYSSDNSVLIINEWIKLHSNQEITFIKHSKNIGICKSLNEALQITTGKYLGFIACDDIMMKNKISTQVQILEDSSTKSGAVYSDANMINNGSIRVGKTYFELIGKSPPTSEDVYFELLKNSFIHLASMLIKREVFLKIGNFDEKLSFEDYDFNLRMAKEFNLVFSDYISIEYRKHGQNISNNLSSTYVLSYAFVLLKQKSNKKTINQIIRKRLNHLLIAQMSQNGEYVDEIMGIISKEFYVSWVIQFIYDHRIRLKPILEIIFNKRNILRKVFI